MAQYKSGKEIAFSGSCARGLTLVESKVCRSCSGSYEPEQKDHSFWERREGVKDKIVKATKRHRCLCVIAMAVSQHNCDVNCHCRGPSAVDLA